MGKRLIRWADHLVNRGLDREKRYVGKPLRRRVYLRAVLVVLTVFAAGLVKTLYEGEWPATIAWLVMGLLAGWGAAVSMTRALAYRRGYHAGRRQVIESMQEAMRRGMPFDQWMLNEFERTIMLHADEYGYHDEAQAGMADMHDIAEKAASGDFTAEELKEYADRKLKKRKPLDGSHEDLP